MRSLLRVWLVAIVTVAVAGNARAQSVTASTDRTRVEAGERVAFTVEVEGRDAAGAVVEPPVGEGLSLLSRTPSLRALTSVNGRARLTMRWLYTADRAGTGRLGSARVVAGGRTLRTDPILVTVTATSSGGRTTQPPPAGASNEEIYVRAVVNPARPYVGQQVVVDYILYFRGHIEPRSAQFVGAWQAEGLWREELDVPASARSPRPAGNGYWSVTVRRVALFPTRTGDVRLGPLSFDIELLRREEDPFGFFGAFSTSFDRASPSAPAVELVARPLPPGAPAGFSGAVGDFALKAELDRNAADAGEPLRLTAVVEGTGNLATLQPPMLEVPRSFEQFDPDEERTIDRTRAPAPGSKTFRWALVPSSGGAFEVGVSMAYFDPETGAYRTLAVEPLRIEVGGAVDPEAVAADGPAPAMEATRWTAPRGRPGVGWLAAGAAIPLAALAGLALASRASRPPRRRPPARFAAPRAAVDDPPEFYRALSNDLRAALDSGVVAASHRAEAEKLLATAERALFAPGPPPAREERLKDLARAEELVGEERRARSDER